MPGFGAIPNSVQGPRGARDRTQASSKQDLCSNPFYNLECTLHHFLKWKRGFKGAMKMTQSEAKEIVQIV